MTDRAEGALPPRSALPRSLSGKMKGRTFCLDVTRLVRRVGRRHTGVDRVEWAYLRWLLSCKDASVFGLVRTRLGYLLLGRASLNALYEQGWDKTDLLSRFTFRLSPERRKAESRLRALAVARSVPHRLRAMLQANLPAGVIYLNVGHSNLTPRVLSALDDVSGAKCVVLIHDLIPLTHPETQRSGITEKFSEKMRNVARHADLILCNSQATEREVQHHFRLWGEVPQTCVAPLGLDLTQAQPEPAPPVPDPYVVCIGTIEPRKNHALLLDLWENWPGTFPPPALVICGARGWKNDAVFARLDAAKSGPLAIHEFNTLSDGQLLSVLKGARAALFPSIAEGYGLPQIEAAALGIPVICGALDIYQECLGDLPVYVKGSDLYSWHNALEEALQQDKDERASAATDLIVPDWQTHFNLVLNELG